MAHNAELKAQDAPVLEPVTEADTLLLADAEGDTELVLVLVGVTGTTMVNWKPAAEGTPGRASVAVRRKVKEPGAVGTPDTFAPSAASAMRVRPGGSEPAVTA